MKNTERFTDRAKAYAFARPSYPAEVPSVLLRSQPGTAVDLGCGTGLFSQILLQAGWKVVGIEPNQAMANHLAPRVKQHPSFTFQGAPAEATTLPAKSFDLVAAAQAFHWFDPVLVRQEMERLLRPGGQILLVWNTREEEPGFGQAYSQLVDQFRPSEEADTAHHRDWTPERLARWFAPRTMSEFSFPNPQVMDWSSVRNRAASTSYLPAEGTPRWNELESRLRQAFDRFQKDGFVSQGLVTKVYLG